MLVRNRWRRAIDLFLKQTKSFGKDKVTFIGKDHLGNNYYEAERPNHPRRFQRFFKKDSYEGLTDVVDAVKVPPSWDAWLRFRRKDPPSELEVKECEEYYETNQARSVESQTNNTEGTSDTKQSTKRSFPKLPLR